MVQHLIIKFSHAFYHTKNKITIVHNCWGDAIFFHDLDKDECGSNPCQHGGRCIDHVNRYSCFCIPGYIGLRCQTGIYVEKSYLNESLN